MKYKTLGATSLTVSTVGMGCARLASVSGRAGKQEALRLVQVALDSGVTFFDTADSYGQGDSERLLARALRHDREGLVIATKVGFRLSPVARAVRPLKPVLRAGVRISSGVTRSAAQLRSTASRQDFSPGHIREAVDRSLARLRTDSIDLLQLHSPPTELLRDPAVWALLGSLQQQGKIRFYGVSAASVEDASSFVGVEGLGCIQLELNLLVSHALDMVVPAARERGVGIVARQPFGSGRLLRDRQRALEFALSADGVAAVLVGTTSVDHLRENLATAARKEAAEP